MEVLLGDVGSRLVDFLLGSGLPHMGAGGLWALALILPLYYLVDATITLIGRVLRGEKLWHAPREHYYQRAFQNGHANVGETIQIGNWALLGLTVAALHWPWAALGGGVLVMTLLWRLEL